MSTATDVLFRRLELKYRLASAEGRSEIFAFIDSGRETRNYPIVSLVPFNSNAFRSNTCWVLQLHKVLHQHKQLRCTVRRIILRVHPDVTFRAAGKHWHLILPSGVTQYYIEVTLKREWLLASLLRTLTFADIQRLRDKREPRFKYLPKTQLEGKNEPAETEKVEAQD